MTLLGAIVFVLKSVGFRFISDDVSFNLVSIGVIIGERCMDLRRRYVSHTVDDFFRAQAELIPAHDAAHCNSGPSNSRASTAYIGAANDKAAYVHYGFQEFDPPISAFCPVESKA